MGLGDGIQNILTNLSGLGLEYYDYYFKCS
jgi:hypothetical protein